MNQTNPPFGAPQVPWPTSDDRVRVPDTSMLPGSDKAASAGVGMLNHAVQGTHDNVDRLADSVAPEAQQPGERVSAAGDAIHAKTDRWRDTRDPWVEGVRTTVRRKPLLAMAAALALGAVIARVAR